jgi:serine/threonine protein kinase
MTGCGNFRGAGCSAGMVASAATPRRDYNDPHGWMALASGTRLGPYEILAPLGAGGMGEVYYRARGREVAVKVLPESFVRRGELLRRFEQEARAVAALSHPNMLALEAPPSTRRAMTVLRKGQGGTKVNRKI